MSKITIEDKFKSHFSKKYKDLNTEVIDKFVNDIKNEKILDSNQKILIPHLRLVAKFFGFIEDKYTIAPEDNDTFEMVDDLCQSLNPETFEKYQKEIQELAMGYSLVEYEFNEFIEFGVSKKFFERNSSIIHLFEDSMLRGLDEEEIFFLLPLIVKTDFGGGVKDIFSTYIKNTKKTTNTKILESFENTYISIFSINEDHDNPYIEAKDILTGEIFKIFSSNLQNIVSQNESLSFYCLTLIKNDFLPSTDSYTTFGKPLWVEIPQNSIFENRKSEFPVDIVRIEKGYKKEHLRIRRDFITIFEKLFLQDNPKSQIPEDLLNALAFIRVRYLSDLSE
ncbi:MAG: hypothetical protein ACRCXZ_03755 [Patescibacteria group bacterium]